MLATGIDTLDAIIDDLGERAARGERVALLWDMDGTLVDTRLRMLTAVHAFGRTDVRIGQVSPSWQETATRLGLHRERFRTVWQRVFWAYESFEADTIIEPTAERARRAESLGIETIIVTGRVDELRPVTDRQLLRLGLKPTHVFLKPTMAHSTPVVKSEVILQLAQEGIHLGAFVTDSVEEIAEVVARSPSLPCIFVALEGTAAPLGSALFPVAVEAAPEAPRTLFAKGASEPICFGFEAEYEIAAADALLLLYAPVDHPEWREWTPQRRADWVRAQFPVPHSEDFALAVVRTTEAPELAFLPAHLVIDSDGNVEVVSLPTDSMEELWTQIETLETACGPALLQVTLSTPSSAVFADPVALDGFLTFHSLLDGFERMAVGHAMVGENSDRDVLLPFLHPWLGPLTAGKHRFLRTYLECNARGERLDEKWRLLVTRAFSSFKYIGGSAYRPGLAGPDRVAIEIRDGHRNKALLAQRVVRNTSCFVAGLEPYRAFAETWAFDSEADYERLPADIRAKLEALIGSRERPEIAHMYSEYDRVALQVYRHFALPLKDYSDVERALGEKLPSLVSAREAYLERLRVCDSGQRAQAALAAFAVESGLHERLQAFCPAPLPLLPLSDALPRTAWTGPLSRRLERLRSDADYLDAVAVDTVSLRATDQGVLEVRYGDRVFTPGETESVAYEPRPDVREVLLALTPLQSLHLRRRLAAHDPCYHAAVRVSASGWFRHLVELPWAPPESIETAKQVVDLAHGSAAWVRGEDSPSTIASGFPADPLDDFLKRWPGHARQVEDDPFTFGDEGESRRFVALSPRGLSDEDSARFAEDYVDSMARHFRPDAPLEDFVARWPGHARLVEDVPFTFGKGSQLRRVLVLAMRGLGDADAARFAEDYVDCIVRGTISFPLREGAEHLRTRIGTLTFALSPEGMRVNDYQAPRGRRRLEAVLELQPDEILRLRRNVGAIIENTLGVLGPITLEAGSRQTHARLEDNRPRDGGQHNCTTWITLAPVGAQGEDVATLAEMPAHWTSHDNPGWWSMFLTGASRSPRARTVVYWTDRALDEEPCASGQAIPWDFNPK